MVYNSLPIYRTASLRPFISWLLRVGFTEHIGIESNRIANNTTTKNPVRIWWFGLSWDFFFGVIVAAAADVVASKDKEKTMSASNDDDDNDDVGNGEDKDCQQCKHAHTHTNILFGRWIDVAQNHFFMFIPPMIFYIFVAMQDSTWDFLRKTAPLLFYLFCFFNPNHTSIKRFCFCSIVARCIQWNHTVCAWISFFFTLL